MKMGKTRVWATAAAGTLLLSMLSIATPQTASALSVYGSRVYMGGVARCAMFGPIQAMAGSVEVKLDTGQYVRMVPGISSSGWGRYDGYVASMPNSGTWATVTVQCDIGAKPGRYVYRIWYKPTFWQTTGNVDFDQVPFKAPTVRP